MEDWRKNKKKKNYSYCSYSATWTNQSGTIATVQNLGGKKGSLHQKGHCRGIASSYIVSRKKSTNRWLEKKKKYILNKQKVLWGAKTWTFMLGLKPHLLTRMHPRRRKCLEKPHSGWSCGEMFEGTSPRGLSSSDLTNVGQVSFCLTWVIFQEIPTTRIDFRCVKKG